MAPPLLWSCEVNLKTLFEDKKAPYSLSSSLSQLAWKQSTLQGLCAQAVMDAVSKPLVGKKRALLIAIQHIECKDAKSEFAGLDDLRFAHRDAEALCGFLIDHHGYQQDDIILMKDDRDHPRDLWPTRKNILHQINRLTSDVSEDCHFFFYYSGHGVEEECHDRASTRANGRDEEIVSADGKPILDHLLHDRLIVPLQNIKGTKLFALFDCCHSETLLDLQRGSRPNDYQRVWNCGRDQVFKAIARVVGRLLALNKRHSKERHRGPRRASTKWSSPPVAKTHEFEELSVICLSACRDGQLAHDYGELTFTKCFLEAAEIKPSITWTELRDAVKQELISKIQSKYEAISFACPQEPRYSTGSYTDLTQQVDL